MSNSAAANIVFNASGGSGQQINWTTVLQYQTSSARGPFSSTHTFTSTSGVDDTEQYASAGGQLTANLDCSSTTSQATITGVAILRDTITTRLVGLYATGATPRLLTGIAQVESGYRQFRTNVIFGVTDLWPIESGEAVPGSHIGLMQMPISMQMAWDWVANTQGAYNLFLQKLSSASRIETSIRTAHTGLRALNGVEHERMAVLLYGPGASADLGMQYYIPKCSGTVSGAACQGGTWDWIVNSGGNSVGVTYVNNVWSSIQ